jgi:hypothetical protein
VRHHDPELPIVVVARTDPRHERVTGDGDHDGIVRKYFFVVQPELQ